MSRNRSISPQPGEKRLITVEDMANIGGQGDPAFRVGTSLANRNERPFYLRGKATYKLVPMTELQYLLNHPESPSKWAYLEQNRHLPTVYRFTHEKPKQGSERYAFVHAYGKVLDDYSGNLAAIRLYKTLEDRPPNPSQAQRDCRTSLVDKTMQFGLFGERQLLEGPSRSSSRGTGATSSSCEDVRGRARTKEGETGPRSGSAKSMTKSQERRMTSAQILGPS